METIPRRFCNRYRIGTDYPEIPPSPIGQRQRHHEPAINTARGISSPAPMRTAASPSKLLRQVNRYTSASVRMLWQSGSLVVAEERAHLERGSSDRFVGVPRTAFAPLHESGQSTFELIMRAANSLSEPQPDRKPGDRKPFGWFCCGTYGCGKPRNGSRARENSRKVSDRFRVTEGPYSYFNELDRKPHANGLRRPSSVGRAVAWELADSKPVTSRRFALVWPR